MANLRRQVFKRLTWWNVTVDWSWRRKFYESDVIWKGVRVPQRVSPSVVGTDFNPGNINVSSECREVKQKTSRQVWAPVGLIWGPDIVGSKHDVEVGSAVNTVCRGQHEGLRYQWTSTEPGRDNQGDSKNGKQPTTNIRGKTRHRQRRSLPSKAICVPQPPHHQRCKGKHYWDPG